MAGATYIGVPTLGAKLLLTDPGEILIDLIRRFQVNYEGCSDITPALTASYQQLITHYGDNRHALADEVKDTLKTLFNRVFPQGANIDLTVSTETGGGGPDTYTLIIDVSLLMNGVRYRVNPKITISQGIPVISNDKVEKINIADIQNGLTKG